MKRLICLILCILMAVSLTACSLLRRSEPAVSETSPPVAVVTPIPTAPPSAIVLPTDKPGPESAPYELSLPEPVEGWADSYISFLDDNYDIFAALWPEGITGVGFIDLDLDGTPEMVVFDAGAAATMGVQFFDLIDGKVFCVSSVLEDAAGAFGREHYSQVSVCASFFESFRLSYADGRYCFWVDSANGTMESSWDEIVRFDCVNGALTPVSVCARFLENDAETGLVVTERYVVGSTQTDAASFDEAAKKYTDGLDMSYDADGVFLWNDLNRYDTTYDGLMAMAKDAVEQYAAINA